jgi:hypothetical protein
MSEVDSHRSGGGAQFDLTRLSVVSAETAAKIKALAGLAAALPPSPVAAPLEPRPPEPGVERWSIKTGTDDNAVKVGTNAFSGIGEAGIVDTTVEELISLLRPADMLPVNQNHEKYQDLRAEPVEFVIWRLVADITVIKKEDDGDLHIVLQGVSGDTCVAEAPTARPPFVGNDSPWLDTMKTVREKIAAKFGPRFAGVPFLRLGKVLVPESAIAPGTPVAGPRVVPVTGTDIFDMALPFQSRVPPTPAEVVGVGFFDRVHRQTGVSLSNGIELHPILSIDFR